MHSLKEIQLKCNKQFLVDFDRGKLSSDGGPLLIKAFLHTPGIESLENFIGEGKQGFDFASVSSQSKTVNANRFQLHALVYNIFNWFRRFALPKHMSKNMIDTVRLKLLKIAARVAIPEDM